MSRLTAADRLRRLLAVIPWVSGRGSVTLEEIAERFDYPLDRLRRDLTEVVQFVGVYPYTPDMMIEVVLDGDDERVSFALADYFAAPLRLTPEEALSLVSGGLGLLGAEEGLDGALERGLTKVAARFGVEVGDALDVNLGLADPAMVAELRRAADARHCVEIDYYSLQRNAAAKRVVEPHLVFSQDGEWYLTGHCRLADEVRTFRVDRILEWTELDESFSSVGDRPRATFAPSEDDLRVTLAVTSAASWIAEAFPVENVDATDDGGLVVTLAVSNLAWLERLLLQLGPDASIVSSVPELAGSVRADAARALLGRYQKK